MASRSDARSGYGSDMVQLRAFVRLALRHACERGDVPAPLVDAILARAQTAEELVEAIVCSEGDVISIKRAVFRVRVWQMLELQQQLREALTGSRLQLG